MSGELLAGAATVFVVSDIAKSIAYYRDGSASRSRFNMDLHPPMRACAGTRLPCTFSHPAKPGGCRATAASACS